MSVYLTCYECDLIWQKILADVIKWKISQWGSLGLSRWVLNPVASDFIKSVEREIWNPSGEGESKIEIEIAVMGPQAQKHFGATENWKRQEWTLVWSLQRKSSSSDTLFPDFRAVGGKASTWIKEHLYFIHHWIYDNVMVATETNMCIIKNNIIEKRRKDRRERKEKENETLVSTYQVPSQYIYILSESNPIHLNKIIPSLFFQPHWTVEEIWNMSWQSLTHSARKSWDPPG